MEAPIEDLNTRHQVMGLSCHYYSGSTSENYTPDTLFSEKKFLALFKQPNYTTLLLSPGGGSDLFLRQLLIYKFITYQLFAY